LSFSADLLYFFWWYSSLLGSMVRYQ